jgi:hypothetical protein
VGPFLECLLISRDRLFERARVVLELADARKHVAEIVLSPGPFGWREIAGPHLERLLIGRGCLFELSRIFVALAKSLKRTAKIVLRRSPVERHTFACSFLQGHPEGKDCLLKCGALHLFLPREQFGQAKSKQHCTAIFGRPTGLRMCDERCNLVREDFDIGSNEIVLHACQRMTQGNNPGRDCRTKIAAEINVKDKRPFLFKPIGPTLRRVGFLSGEIKIEECLRLDAAPDQNIAPLICEDFRASA